MMVTIVVAAIVTLALFVSFLLILGVLFAYPWLLLIPVAIWIVHYASKLLEANRAKAIEKDQARHRQ